MLLYLTLGACAMGIAWLVFRYDLYDREPLVVLVLAVVLGAAAMWVAGHVQVWGMTALGPFAARHWNPTMAAMAGLTEEAAKLAVVLTIALLLPRTFNDPMDGLVYGSFAGLGCAIEESVALIGWPRPDGLAPGQEVVRLAGHLVMGGIGGWGVGRWAEGHPRWPLAVLASFTLAASLHTAWDVVAFDAHDRGYLTSAHVAASIALMLVGFITYRAMVVSGARSSRVIFSPTP